MHKFKVGQKVCVKKPSVLIKQGKNELKNEWASIGFVGGYMEDFGGQTVTIRAVDTIVGLEKSINIYKIKEDKYSYSWAEIAFEPLDISEYTEEDVVNHRI